MPSLTRGDNLPSPTFYFSFQRPAGLSLSDTKLLLTPRKSKQVKIRRLALHGQKKERKDVRYRDTSLTTTCVQREDSEDSCGQRAKGWADDGGQ